MKRVLLLLLSLHIFMVVQSYNLRRSLLEKDPVKYEALVDAAKKTTHQLLKFDIDFKDTYICNVEDDKNKCTVTITEGYVPFPSEQGQVFFIIKDGSPDLNALDTLLTKQKIEKLPIFDGVYDIKEKLTLYAQSIAAGFSNGNATLYQKSGETVASLHIKCFVNSNNGDEYGAFEIYISDKNDKNEIVEKNKSWWEKIKKYVTEGSAIIVSIAGAISAILGVVKDYKTIPSGNASLFLEVPWLLPLVCLISLIF